jgi:hypothetical protein
MRHAMLLSALALLAACGDWPDLGLPEADAPGYPQLVPFDQLTGQAALTPEEAEAAAQAEAALAARAEALRARAVALDAAVAENAAPLPPG